MWWAGLFSNNYIFIKKNIKKDNYFEELGRTRRYVGYRRQASRAALRPLWQVLISLHSLGCRMFLHVFQGLFTNLQMKQTLRRYITNRTDVTRSPSQKLRLFEREREAIYCCIFVLLQHILLQEKNTYKKRTNRIKNRFCFKIN